MLPKGYLQTQGDGVGGRRRTPTGNYKTLISKWYQKSIKTFKKTLKTARHGGHTGQALQAPVKLPYTLEVYPGAQAIAPSLLKMLRIHGDGEDIQTTQPELPLQVWDQRAEILARSSESQKLGEMLAKPHTREDLGKGAVGGC